MRAWGSVPKKQRWCESFGGKLGWQAAEIEDQIVHQDTCRIDGRSTEYEKYQKARSQNGREREKIYNCQWKGASKDIFSSASRLCSNAHIHLSPQTHATKIPEPQLHPWHPSWNRNADSGGKGWVVVDARKRNNRPCQIIQCWDED